jgi:hypothetical protein
MEDQKEKPINPIDWLVACTVILFSLIVAGGIITGMWLKGWWSYRELQVETNYETGRMIRAVNESNKQAEQIKYRVDVLEEIVGNLTKPEPIKLEEEQ